MKTSVKRYEARIVEPGQKLSEADTTSLYMDFGGDGGLQIIGRVLRQDRPPDTRLVLPMPTVFNPTPATTTLGAMLVGSRVARSRDSGDTRWTEEFELDLRLGKRLVLDNYFATLRTKRVAEHVALYVPDFGDVHSHFVERNAELPVGPGVTIWPRHRAVEVNGAPTEHTLKRSTLGATIVLAEAQGEFVSHRELAVACEIDREAVRQVVRMVRGHVTDMWPSGYAVRSDRIEGYRLQIPDNGAASDETLAEPLPNA